MNAVSENLAPEEYGHRKQTAIPALQPIEVTAPDGGYGWIILAASIYMKHIIPSILIAFGLFLVFMTIETSTTSELRLWTNDFIYIPVLFMSVKALSDPLCYLIIKNSKWPRFVCLCGVCLICSSILLLWLSLIDRHTSIMLKIMSGIFAGIGSSLLLIQISSLVSLYFHIKLRSVLNILEVSECCGFIYTSLILGKYLNKQGIPHTIIWYHLVILLSGILVLVLRKPDYLKGQSVYNVAQHVQDIDGDEDIFTNTRELQSPHTSLPPIETDNPQNTTSNKVTDATTESRYNWVNFDDSEEPNDNVNELPIPRELFAESQINNNVTYSFEITDNMVASNPHDETTNIFLPTVQTSKSYEFLFKFSFYKKSLLFITINFTTFVFYILFPSYLYYSVNTIHKESIAQIISVIFLITLVESLFIDKWQMSRSNRSFFVASLSYVNAIGNFLISATNSEIPLIFGAMFIVTSLHAHKFIMKSLIKNTGRTKIEYVALQILTGTSFILFLTINPSYGTCFSMIGLLQFSCGSIWFCNFVYQKIVSVY